MKKWVIAMLLFAFVAGEMGCVVRVKDRKRPYPPPQPRTAMVY